MSKWHKRYFVLGNLDHDQDHDQDQDQDHDKDWSGGSSGASPSLPSPSPDVPIPIIPVLRYYEDGPERKKEKGRWELKDRLSVVMFKVVGISRQQ